MLSPQQAQTLTAWLNNKWRDSRCRQCQANAWDIHGILSMSLANQPGAIFGGPSLPMAAVLCRNCGNTVFVNLVVAGVLPSGPPDLTGAA